MTSPTSLWRYSIFNLLLLGLLGIWLWCQNQPVSIVKPALPDGGKLSCVSYAPYYGKDQSPFIKGTIVSKAQIESDLKLLSARFDCVRTYSVAQGLDYVPEAAEKIGMKVYLGAWIGWTKRDNDLEVARAIALANQYPETIKAVIVGNEVLLRREQSEKTLKVYIDQVKAATKVPVTYADVWEFWLKHKNLEKSVDFVTVHILPYWENDPQSIEHALTHAQTVMASLSGTFSKPILIGETGWPSIGRQRGEAVPSLVNQARYMREFLALAEANQWKYNVIEAIDQPWKRLLEGTVGGYWGLYDTDLQPKFDFRADVSERNDSASLLYAALLGLATLVAIALWVGERRVSAIAAHSVLGALIGVSILLQAEYIAVAARTVFEWAVLGFMGAATTITLMCLPALLKPQSSDSAKAAVNAGLFLTSLGALVAGLLMVLDGRYRDFPLAIYMLPILQLSIGTWVAGKPLQTRSNFYFWSNILAGVSALIFLAVEPKNLHAVIWIILIALLTGASWPKRQQG